MLPGRKKFWICLLMLLSLGVGAQKQEPCKPAMKRLAATYRGIKTFRAHFVQTLDAPALKQYEREEGELLLASGGKMRWDYSKPTGKIAWIDGQKCFVYLPEDRQVISKPLSESGVVRLLLDFAAFEKEIRCLGSRELPDGSGELDIIVASGEGGELQVTVRVDQKTGLITSLSYQDAIGNTISYSFTVLKVNDELKSDSFKVALPKGTTVSAGS